MASDWRRAWTNNQWFESEVDGFARRHGQIALMPAGAVLERTIIDYQWQWRYGPTNDFDSRHFEMVLIGVHITSEDLTAPLLWPRENNSDENCIPVISGVPAYRYGLSPPNRIRCPPPPAILDGMRARTATRSSFQR